MLDSRDRTNRAVTQQVENLQRVIMEYVEYQQRIFEMRRETDFNADEVRLVLGNFQDMIDIVYRDLLVASEGQIAQQVRYWRQRKDVATE